MSIFRVRRSAPAEPLIVSIAGVKLGARLLAVTGSDPSLIVPLAAKTGLTGRVLVLATDAADPARLSERILSQGIAADVERLQVPLPVPDEGFDVALVDDRTSRTGSASTVALFPELRRILRPGGRVVIVSRAPGSIFARWRQAPPPDVSATLDASREAGLTAARLIAARGGLVYVEAVRPAA